MNVSEQNENHLLQTPKAKMEDATLMAEREELLSHNAVSSYQAEISQHNLERL